MSQNSSTKSEDRSATAAGKTLRIQVTERLREWSDQLPTLRDARETFDRLYLEELLRHVGGNVTAAARISGRNRTDLYDLLRRCQLDPTSFRS